MPDGIYIQHPDIQSPFNTAYLLRGNQIFTDFYDCPEKVDILLDIVIDYMIELVPHLKKKMDNRMVDWFFDYGALWKGAARISNCSMHMISPELYVKHIFPRDKRLMHEIGGGRMHYCGTSHKVVPEFFKLPGLFGFDFNCDYHSLWELSEIVPEKTTLFAQIHNINHPTCQRLLSGDWPNKRNIIVVTNASCQKQARELLDKLRKSVPRSFD